MIKSPIPYTEVLEIMMGNLYLESDFGPYVMRILSSEGDYEVTFIFDVEIMNWCLTTGIGKSLALSLFGMVWF